MKNEAFGIKSLISVLSLLLAFLLVCFVVVLILVNTGIMNIDWIIGKNQQNQDIQPPTDQSTVIGEQQIIKLDEAKIREILSELPFYDTFYARVVTNLVGNHSANVDETYLRYDFYDVFKYGNKYKIVKYNRFQEEITVETCDGIHIKIENAKTNEVNYYLLGESDNFALHSPLPDFSMFKTEEYEIESYSFDNDICTVVCVMKSMGLRDVVSINMNDGMITSFETTSFLGNDSYLYSYSVGNYTIGSNNGQKYKDSDFQIR